VRLGVGNVFGDSPSRKFEQPRDNADPSTIQAQTGNAGQVLDPNLVDPRSLDVVVVKKDGSVYVIEGRYDDGSSFDVVSAMQDHADPLKDRSTGNAFQFATAREITSIDVHDMNGDGLADIVLGYEDDDPASPIYRSIIYISTDVTKPGATDLRLEEKTLSPSADGAGTGAVKDTSSTRRLLIVDQDLDGNSDLVYASDENGPARVTYARPKGDTSAPTANEQPLGTTTDGLSMRDKIKEGMMKWIDQALQDAFNDANGAHHTNQNHANSNLCGGAGGEFCRPDPQRGMISNKNNDYGLPTHFNEETHPEQYEFSITDGTLPVQTLAGPDPVTGDPGHPMYVPEYWMPREGDPAPSASSAAANDPQGTRGHCRDSLVQQCHRRQRYHRRKRYGHTCSDGNSTRWA